MCKFDLGICKVCGIAQYSLGACNPPPTFHAGGVVPNNGKISIVGTPYRNRDMTAFIILQFDNNSKTYGMACDPAWIPSCPPPSIIFVDDILDQDIELIEEDIELDENAV